MAGDEEELVELTDQERLVKLERLVMSLTGMVKLLLVDRGLAGWEQQRRVVRERNRCAEDVCLREKAFRVEEGARKVAASEKRRLEKEKESESAARHLRDAQKEIM